MRRSQAAFTFAEVLIALVISTVLAGIVVDMLCTGVRIMGGVEANLDAMHSAHQQLEVLVNDLRKILLRSGTDRAVFPQPAVGITPANALAFDIAAPGPSGNGVVYVGRRVRYAAVPVDAGAFYLSRNGVVTRDLRLARVNLELVVHPALDRSGSLYFVRAQLSGTDHTLKKRFTVTSVVAIDPVVEGQRTPAYNPAPDLLHPLLGFAAPPAAP